ncbi:hypothetical protein T484DRAFT_1875961 [Baffinella frigidus]|nr:hypothetical protein T484DRAFT_1875961 [Cryptophyta sp. CCMP2293]
MQPDANLLTGLSLAGSYRLCWSGNAGAQWFALDWIYVRAIAAITPSSAESETVLLGADWSPLSLFAIAAPGQCGNNLLHLQRTLLEAPLDDVQGVGQQSGAVKVAAHPPGEYAICLSMDGEAGPFVEQTGIRLHLVNQPDNVPDKLGLNLPPPLML